MGINTAIVAPSGGNVGIGFAIPSNLVAAIMDEIIEHGAVRRGRIGMTVAALNAQLADALGMDETRGVVVTEVSPGGAADLAGVERGDIVARINGRAIERASDFGQQEAVAMLGDTLDVELVRDGRLVNARLSIQLDWSVAGERIHPRLAGTVLKDLHVGGDVEENAGVWVSSIERARPPGRQDCARATWCSPSTGTPSRISPIWRGA